MVISRIPHCLPVCCYSFKDILFKIEMHNYDVSQSICIKKTMEIKMFCVNQKKLESNFPQMERPGSAPEGPLEKVLPKPLGKGDSSVSHKRSLSTNQKIEVSLVVEKGAFRGSKNSSFC